MTTPPPYPRIAIIGAGAGGLVTLRALLTEPTPPRTIHCFEQRSLPGGVWNHTPERAPTPIPAPSPHTPEPPLHTPTGPVFPSAVYDDLETNIPKPLMCFPGAPFAADAPLFPGHADVARYLHGYAAGLHAWIRVDTRVVDARKHAGGWALRLREERTGREYAAEYDAVVVAAGHYARAFVPAVAGLAEWARAHPGRVLHSRAFRTPREFEGRRVLLVGNAASGYDVARLLVGVAAEVWQSVRTAGGVVAEGVREVGEIARFEPEGRAVRFVGGEVMCGVDAVVFCTGYLHSLPWLRTDPPVVVSGARVLHTFLHVFYHPDPSLAFVGLPVKVIPFPTMQSQAALVARVFTGRLKLPGAEVMRRWEHEEVVKKGNGKGFSVYGFPADAEYLDELERMCDEAGEGGLEPARWREWERWVRPRVVKIKGSYAEAKRRGRRDIRTMEELGWCFEERREPEDQATPWVT